MLVSLCNSGAAQNNAQQEKNKVLLSDSNCPTTSAVFKKDSASNSAATAKESARLEKMRKKLGIVRPPFLKQGDSVGILTVSSPMEASRQEADSLIDIVRSWGLKVRTGENLYKHEAGAFSVSDKERGEEMQRMIDNDNIKAIIFYRGGYGAIRTMDYVNFTPLLKHPKWIVGFSDLTTYISVFCNMKYESIHGEMPGGYNTRHPETDINALTTKAALFGNVEEYKVEPNKYSQYGEAEGILVGGNMSLMSMAYGTPYDLKITGNEILYIEEVDEKMDTIDRFLQQLKKSGKLQKIKGLMVGSFVRAKDNAGWGFDVYDLIKTYTKDLNIPVLYGIRCGHGKINHALYMGAPVKLSVTPQGGTVIF